MLDRQHSSTYNAPTSRTLRCWRAVSRRFARVAQLVEHTTENRSVGGSIPPPGTSYTKELDDRAQSELTLCGSFAGLALQRASHNKQFRLTQAPVANTVGCFYQARQLGGRIVCRDAARSMTQQVLTILETDPGRSQSTTKSMLEIVNSDLLKSRFNSCPQPA